MCLESRIRDAARRHKPRGWRIKERESRHNCDGQATAARVIYCPPLRDENALYVLLHECGHVHHGHVVAGRTKPDDKPLGWLEEYEAEAYAIGAMRAEGFRVSHDTVREAREYVAGHFHQHHDLADLDHPHFRRALRFAFPSTWREHL